MATAETIKGLPAGVQPVQRTTPKDAIEVMMAEDRALRARIKLTWNDATKLGVPDDRMVGEVNLYLPYMKLVNKYYIQNAKVFLSNGEPTSLEFIAVTDPNNFPMVRDALETFRQDAAARDPLLCKVCRQYVARNIEDYADHRESAHADVVAAKLGVQIADEPEFVGVKEIRLGVEPEPESVPEPAPQYTCCGRQFKNALGIKIHQKRMHGV